MACNRGIYHKGWTAVTRHSVPWDFGAKLPALDDDVWERMTPRPIGPRPTMSPPSTGDARSLQRLWLIEAVKYNVLPIDDRRIERFNSDSPGARSW